MSARFIVIALLALVTDSAAASDWQSVGSNENGSFTMDVASLLREGPVVRAWLRSVYTKPLDGPGGAKTWAVLSRNYFDCKNRRWAIKQSTYFADTRFERVLQIGPDTRDALLDWSEVPPDTGMEVPLEFACSHAPE